MDNAEYHTIIRHEKIIKYDKKYDTIRKIIWTWHRYTNISKLYEKKKYVSKFI